jgi:diadenylate cyclase
MSEIFNNIISGVGITDVIDVAIVAFVIYKVLGFIQETRALQLVKGLLVLALVTVLSDKFNLYTLNWILRNTMTLGVIALVIVFQPELRRALEYVGRSKFITPQFAQMDKERVKMLTTAIIKAVDYFSSNKVGALIIMERETTLNDIAEADYQRTVLSDSDQLIGFLAADNTDSVCTSHLVNSLVYGVNQVSVIVKPD